MPRGMGPQLADNCGLIKSHPHAVVTLGFVLETHLNDKASPASFPQTTGLNYCLFL